MAWNRHFSLVLGLTIAGLGFAWFPIALAFKSQQEKRHFRTVREGIFYRSGQMTGPGLARIVHDFGIRTVISLRDASREGDTPPDFAEEAWCRESGLNYHRFRPLPWEGIDGSPAPVEKNVSRYLDVLKNPDNYPVLLHCFAGIHRTGTYTAIYRMEVEGWALDRAMNEMRNCGYSGIEQDKDLHGFLTSYRPGERLKGLPKVIGRDSMLLPATNISHATGH